MTDILRYDFPRDCRRESFSRLCLNGKWHFAFDPEKCPERNSPFRELYITVPFVPESKLSGIEYTDAIYRVYYKRSYTLPTGFSRGRTLLHIGAMDYEGRVEINGRTVGTHRGGYTPAVFDITEYQKPGENEIFIAVTDDNEDPLQPSGKQAADKPHGCFYTHCTGIWQSVWLENVPASYIEAVHFTPDVYGEKVLAKIKVCGEKTDGIARISVSFRGETVAKAEIGISNGIGKTEIPIKNPVLWDIGQGNLYDCDISFEDDTVSSCFGMRDIRCEGNTVLLNGKPLFMRLVLDQGYYPDGIYTAKCVYDFEEDIKRCMSVGFNGARMHMKIFEPAYMDAADRLGFLLWGEYPNWGLDISRPEAYTVMLPEWEAEMERDYNHPSIIGWCPFNEAFPGECDIIEKIAERTRELDQSRLLIDTSGYIHRKNCDIYDVHDYEQNTDAFKKHYEHLSYFNDLEGNSGYDGKMPYFVSEFGGAFYDFHAVYNNSAQESGNPWGYGNAPENETEFLERLSALCGILSGNTGICGFCYTQFCDVMQEMNGIYTYDRRLKFDKAALFQAISCKKITK